VPGPKPVIYLDACIFISMLTGEQRPNNESAEIAGLAIRIEKKEIIPVTFTITRVEVLECRLNEQQKSIMKNLLRPPKIQIKEATAPITDLAAEIRDHYQRLKDGGTSSLPTVETPDALHLSTAIHYGCTHFYTFDERDVPGGTRPKRALIPLSGTIAGRYQLNICKPTVQALGLPLS
jgi:predicted nucleic acid-binding protein